MPPFSDAEFSFRAIYMSREMFCRDIVAVCPRCCRRRHCFFHDMLVPWRRHADSFFIFADVTFC